MARDDRDYRVELSGQEISPEAPESATAGEKKGRPFLCVHFACCGVYHRIYRSPDARSYDGRCPRCGRSVSFAVGPGGTDSRFFVVR